MQENTGTAPPPKKRLTEIEKRLKRINILVLDSSVQVTTLFKDMLAEFGLTSVYTANSGFQGGQILREVKINLIITDWELKVPPQPSQEENTPASQLDIYPLSGIHFVKRLRHSPNSPNPFIPVIMLASAVEKIQLMEARDAGVNELCIKPLGAQELSGRIIAVIEKPRIFITCDTYRGPCRRRAVMPLPSGQPERRKMEIRLVKAAR